MTEPDDLFAKDKQQKVTDEMSVETVDDAAGGGIADGEVRSVAPPVAARSSNLWLLLLLLIVLAGGYFLLSTPSSTQQGQQPVAVSAPKKQPIPERQVQTESIKQDVVEPKPVAASKPQVIDTPEVVSLPPAADKSVVVAAPPASPAPAVTEQAAAPVVAAAEMKKTVEAVAAPVAVVAAPAEPVALHSVLVGPFLRKADLAAATKQLERLGFEPKQTKGRGIVTMTRLLEGRYPEAEARQRLLEIKQAVGDAFILPDGDKRAIYVGSFTSVERATDYAAQLGKKGIKVTLVATDVEMSGHLLLAVQAAPDIARQAADLIGKSGLKTQIAPE